MEVAAWHGWDMSPACARRLQEEMAGRVSREGGPAGARFVAGTDMSVSRADGAGTAAVVVLSYPGLELVETQVVTGELGFPYVPGLLSFREAPLVIAACARLEHQPDLVLVDGQGIAHPRRLGLASHLGLFLNVPTVGCAKSRLCGRHGAPGEEKGSYAELLDGDEIIGAVLRTKDRVKPLYISIGHKTDLASAIEWVTVCCRGYRLPEPTRLAHLAAGGNLKAAGVPARGAVY